MPLVQAAADRRTLISLYHAAAEQQGYCEEIKLAEAQQNRTSSAFLLMAKKIEFASTDRVEQYRAEIDRVLWHIASIVKEPEETEEEWLGYVFVSDESSLADFIFDDSELRELSERLGVPLLMMRDSFIYVARALRHKEEEHAVDRSQ